VLINRSQELNDNKLWDALLRCISSIGRIDGVEYVPSFSKVIPSLYQLFDQQGLLVRALDVSLVLVSFIESRGDLLKFKIDNRFTKKFLPEKHHQHIDWFLQTVQSKT
jgi:hypothetical protein